MALSGVILCGYRNSIDRCFRHGAPHALKDLPDVLNSFTCLICARLFACDVSVVSTEQYLQGDELCNGHRSFQGLLLTTRARCEHKRID